VDSSILGDLYLQRDLPNSNWRFLLQPSVAPGYAESYVSCLSTYDFMRTGEAEHQFQAAIVRFGWSSILLGLYCYFVGMHVWAKRIINRPFALFLRRFSTFADRSLVVDVIKSMPRACASYLLPRVPTTREIGIPFFGLSVA